MKILKNPFPVSAAAVALYLMGTLMVLFSDKSDISFYIQKLLVCSLQIVPYVVMLSSNITSLRDKKDAPRSTVLATVLASAIMNLILRLLMDSGIQPYGLCGLLDAAEIEYEAFCQAVFWVNLILFWMIPHINKAVIIIYSSVLSVVYIVGIVFQVLDDTLYSGFNDIFSVCFILAAILLQISVILLACSFNKDNAGEGWECLLGKKEDDDEDDWYDDGFGESYCDD